MINVLVLCTGNSCRSQMAEGYLRHFGGDALSVFSAGIETHGINPIAIEVMKEDHIDISHQGSNNVNEYKDMSFDYVITVCDHAKENCPFFRANAKILHQNFTDPAKATGTSLAIIEQFRKVRDEIKLYCEAFVRNNLA
jgi:arsenate reductase (thioredoxin)